MKVYTATELMELLHVGKPTALAIMKSHGFQIGYTKLSPYRITEEQLAKYAEDMKRKGEYLRIFIKSVKLSKRRLISQSILLPGK